MLSILTLFSSIEQGLIFAILAIGLFITFRILDLPDLTVDGSFVTGLAICGMFCLQGHYLMGIIMAMLGGAVCGVVTALLHTKLKIQAILAGILTMTGLYSVNLKIMNLKPTIYFFDQKTIFTFISNKFYLLGVDIGKMLLLLLLVALVIIILNLFLKTKTGLSLRATGDNFQMVRSNGVNTNKMKVIGFSVANALVALSGAIYIEYNMQASHTVGVGMLVLGLASIIIGEAIFKNRTLLTELVAISLGAIVYRIIITFAFGLGLPASDLKLFSAIIVIVAIFIFNIKDRVQKNA